MCFLTSEYRTQGWVTQDLNRRRGEENWKERANLTEFNVPYAWCLPEPLFLNYKALKFMNNTGNL